YHYHHPTISKNAFASYHVIKKHYNIRASLAPPRARFKTPAGAVSSSAPVEAKMYMVTITVPIIA
ncbi:hypothetical protein ACJ72_04792, partial [Emergomyces africanus]